MDTTTMAVAMTVERVLVGAAAIAAPGPLLTTFGAPAEMNNPALRYTTRLFGIRNVALGLQVWSARHDPARLQELAGQNAAVELTDMVAGSALLAGDTPLRGPAVAVMATSVSVAAGFLALRSLARRG
jgi:hypothetical protein